MRVAASIALLGGPAAVGLWVPAALRIPAQGTYEFFCVYWIWKNKVSNLVNTYSTLAPGASSGSSGTAKMCSGWPSSSTGTWSGLYWAWCSNGCYGQGWNNGSDSVNKSKCESEGSSTTHSNGCAQRGGGSFVRCDYYSSFTVGANRTASYSGGTGAKDTCAGLMRLVSVYWI